MPPFDGWPLIRKILLVMKLTTLLLVIALLQVSAKGFSQITVSENNAPAETVIKAIEKQTGYVFIYDEAKVKLGMVSVDLHNANITETLNQLLKDLPITYQIIKKNIVLQPKEVSFIDKIKDKTSGLFADPSNISGTVVDTTGFFLPGASVSLKGTYFTTTTDNKGRFSFSKVPQGSYILVVSYIGYAKLERNIETTGQDLSIKLVLHSSSSQLDQVQIIAYGQTTQRFNVGSVSQVTAKQIEQQPVTNLLQALEGQVPGLVVTQNNGTPGSSISVQIRGQNSLNPNAGHANNFDNPLFIIDGVPFAPQNTNINQYSSLNSNGNSGNDLGSSGMGAFNTINPNDIESIEVLRDADATAIYGSRGANGVILITTKKGKSGKTQFTGNVSTAESSVNNLPQMMNTGQYLAMREEAFKNDGITPSTNPNDPGYAPDLLIFDQNRYTNWEKYFLGGTAHTTDANFALSGGSDNNTFYIGAGFHKEGYIYPGDFSDDKASVNAGFHHSSTNKKLNIDFSVNYAYEDNNSSSNVNLAAAFALPPNYPALLNPNGTLDWNYKGVDFSNYSGISNPIAYEQQPYQAQNYNLVSHFQIEYQLLTGFYLRSGFGYNTFNGNEYAAEPQSAQDPANNPESLANFGTNNFQTWNIEPQAEYKRQIGKGKLDVLIGGTFEHDLNTSTQINAYNFSNDLLIKDIADAGSTYASNGYSLYKYDAIFTRLNYIWDNKYIIDVTGNRDGSSRFGPGRQFGNFGSVGGGWLFSEESLFKNSLPFISYGKLRSSYGITGNDQIGNYQYLSAYQPTNGSSYQGTTGYVPQNLYNPNYSWAETKKFEMGLELGILKDRILADITWFQNRSGNQLVEYSLPSQSGFTHVLQNAPYTVQNSGWEIRLNSKNIITKNFSWNSSVNLTIPKNELLSFPGISSSSYNNIYVVGQPLSVLREFIFDGVNPTTGVFQFLTANGTPTYNPTFYKDYKVIGSLDPKFYGGLNNSFTYKRIQLNINITFTKQLGPNYLSSIYGRYLPGFPFNQPTAVLSRWQNPGNITNIEQYSESYSSNAYNQGYYFSLSNGAFSDASYIRFKTVAMSYSLPSEFLKKAGVQSCRVYLNAQNLFLITSYKGDPETQNYWGLPPLRTIAAGLQFTF